MSKDHYYNDVVKIVSEEFALERIFGTDHCRNAEMSDARTCVCSILYYDIGVNMVQIASLTGLSVSGVCYLVNRLVERQKQCFAFKTSFQRVRRAVFSKIIDFNE